MDLSVDQFTCSNQHEQQQKTTTPESPLAPPSLKNNICTIKQTTTTKKSNPTKYQTTNRSTSLPTRSFDHLNRNIDQTKHERRRYVSDSHRSNEEISSVTTFLQYLRSELRSTTNEKSDCYFSNFPKKCNETTFNFSNQFYRQASPIKMSLPPLPSSSSSSSSSSSESLLNLPEKNPMFDSDENEISTLINLLIRRVEHLNDVSQPIVEEIDQNLLDYLYHLFTKFTINTSTDDCDFSEDMIEKDNFAQVYQSFARHGCLNLSQSPERTLTQTSVREYCNENNAERCSNDQDIWLVVDLESSNQNPAETACLLPSSSSVADEQFLVANDNYFSFEEIKSCGSESSQSNYFSPNSSLVDLQNMVQDLDDNTNSNNNNNNNNLLFLNDGSSSPIDHHHQQQQQYTSNKSNIIKEVHQSTNTNNICTGLTNETNPIDEQVQEITEQNSSSSTMVNDRMSRRERKMQERWNTSTKADPQQASSSHEQGSTKNFLGVEFPPIAVLRRKFSSAPTTNVSTIKRKDHPTSPIKPISPEISDQAKDQEIQQLPSPSPSSPSSNDLSSSINALNDDQSQQQQQQPLFVSVDEQKIINAQINTKDNQQASISPMEYQEQITVPIASHRNDEEQTTNNDQNSHVSSISPDPIASLLSALIVSFPACSATDDLKEKKTSEHLAEEKAEKEEVRLGDDNIIAEEKKNNCSVELHQHASGIIITDNGVDSMQNGLSTQEKDDEEEEEQKQQASLVNNGQPIEEQLHHELSVATRADIDSKTMMTTTDENDNEQRYKTIEIEEIPDDEEVVDEQKKNSIEPTDYIHTDDEPKIILRKSPSQSNGISSEEISRRQPVSEPPENFSTLLKTSKTCPEDDPIALRALHRFEQRMNAAVSAKSNGDETFKGKSSWSGTQSSSRKSLENLFKGKSSVTTNPLPNSEETLMKTSLPTSDSFIRPRRTILEDNTPSYGMTLNLFASPSSNQNDTNNHQTEEQETPKATTANDNTHMLDNSSKMIDVEDTTMIETSMTSESGLGNETETSTSLAGPSQESSSTNSSINTVISLTSSSPSLPNEQQSLTPYRLHLEGRRRLNTLERFRERRQNIEPEHFAHQQQLQNEYTLKPEEVQDPIIRRALERFDEKNRALTQAKPTNYDDIQDPITRRALMRLENNLKRTMPPAPINPDMSETSWYTNSYTLGSLQSNNDPHFTRIPDASLPPPVPHHRTSHISVHQRFNSTSSGHMSDLSTGHLIADDEPRLPIMRVPTQPIYVTSQNPSQPPVSVRQRSRSEDMLSSKDLSFGQTMDLDQNGNEHSNGHLQRNHSSEDLQHMAPSTAEETIDKVLSSATPMEEQIEADTNGTNGESMHYTSTTETFTGYHPEYAHLQQNPPTLSPRTSLPSHEITNGSAFVPVHSSPATYYSQQTLPTNPYTSMYSSNNLNPASYSEDPIVRRALERFNCQMQQSMMGMSHQPAQLQPSSSYMSRQYPNGYPPRSGTVDSFYSNDPHSPDTWTNAYHSMPRVSHPNTNNAVGSGYQSIIGRRRQMRQDDMQFDHTGVGNGYSSSLFINGPNGYTVPNHYMNLPDEPPAIPPRFSRENYMEQADYLCENVNNNNNSNHPLHHHGYIHSATAATVYPPSNNGFRPIHHPYPASETYHPYQDDDYLRHRAQSTSSTTSSDSVNPIRLIHQRLPPTMARTNIPSQRNYSAEQCQIPEGQSPSNYMNSTGDSVFHRLAYTGTKASLSKSSSNLCANLLNKSSLQSTPSSNFQAHEIDLDESNDQSPVESNQEGLSTSTNGSNTNKCQRSRSVDGRARLKNAQMRLGNGSGRANNDYDDQQNTTVPSSKFTSVTTRRESQPIPPRLPVTPRTLATERTSISKRAPSTHNLSFSKPNSAAFRTRGSNGNLLDPDHSSTHDAEHETNSSFQDSYQPKILETKTRTSIPVHRHAIIASASNNGNHLQPSASTSSVSSTMSRSKLSTNNHNASTHLEGKDNNSPHSDVNKSSKRSDDHRVLSPGVQRRPIPVSVFAPAKVDTKRPAPAPPKSSSPSNETPRNAPVESQPTSPPVIGETNQSSCLNDDEDLSMKISSMSSALKSSTGNLLKELSLTNEKTDPNNTNKKMNVFERLFRGHKKKI